MHHVGCEAYLQSTARGDSHTLLVLIHLSGESHNGQIDRECFYKTNS